MRVRCVGAVVLDERGRLLLVKRRNPPAAGRWSVPGGRIEPGESELEAVRREVAEETALDVAVGRHLGRVELDGDPGTGLVFEVDDYLCTVAPGSEPVAGDDALEVRWADLATLDRLELVDGLRRTLAGWSALPR